MDTSSSTDAQGKATMDKKKLFCCCGSCLVCSVLFVVIIVVIIIVVEVLYGTPVPGYIMHEPVAPWDNVRIVYKHETGYTGSFVPRSIWISAPNYESLSVDFKVYRGNCEILNDNTVPPRTVTTNATQWICNGRCLVDEYIYFVTSRESWLAYHILDYHMYNDTVEGSVPPDVVLRFVLFDDQFEFSSFLNGSNDAIPLQQVYIDGKDEAVRFDLSEMKKPASYYFVGIQIIFTNESIVINMNGTVSQVTYYVSNLVSDCFACFADITIATDLSYSKQCFIVQAIPKTVNPPPVINVTAQVFSVNKTGIHIFVLMPGIFFLLAGLCCTICSLCGCTKAKRTISRAGRQIRMSNENLLESSEEGSSHCNALAAGTHNDNETMEVELLHHTADDQESSNLNVNSRPAVNHSSEGLDQGDRNNQFFGIVDFLKSKSAIDCFTLGRHLGISEAILYETEETFGHNKTLYINRILGHWRNTCKDGWSVQAIADALKTSGYHILSAIVINNRFGGNDTSAQATTGIKDNTLLDQLFDKNPVFKQEPLTEELCDLVMTDEIIADWELFGTQLGISKSTMKIIKSDHRECSNCFLQLLDEWKRSQSKPYTWSTVIKVLHSPSFSEHLLDEKVYKFCLQS